MRTLVCGGRHFEDHEKLGRVLDEIDQGTPITIVISGMARGADFLGYRWGLTRQKSVARFHADWRKHGRAAGPIRNQQMLDEGRPDLVVAFSGGHGTADMVRRAKAAGVRVIEVP